MAHDSLNSQLREARRSRGWTQQRAAARLGVTQAYLSMVESGERDAQPLLPKFVRVYDLRADALPLTDERAGTSRDFAVELASFGYPGFSHLKTHRPKTNPAAFLLAALSEENLEARVSEGLPWLVVKYPAMPFDWLVREACARTLQNQLGFVFTLAQAVAPNDALSPWLEKLAECKLVRKEGFCYSPKEPERQWLHDASSPEAKNWNVLSTLAPKHLRYV